MVYVCSPMAQQNCLFDDAKPNETDETGVVVFELPDGSYSRSIGVDLDEPLSVSAIPDEYDRPSNAKIVDQYRHTTY